jgi:hypothetical protein
MHTYVSSQGRRQNRCSPQPVEHATIHAMQNKAK